RGLEAAGEVERQRTAAALARGGGAGDERALLGGVPPDHGAGLGGGPLKSASELAARPRRLKPLQRPVPSRGFSRVARHARRLCVWLQDDGPSSSWVGRSWGSAT